MIAAAPSRSGDAAALIEWQLGMSTRPAFALRRRVFPTARTILLEHDLARLPLAGLRDVLVVGAGDDPYRRWFSGATAYVRMDIRALPGSVDVVADAHHLPFASEAFDCVFAAEVFEHLRDPRRFIAEALRTTRPGGKTILTVPFMFHMHADPYDFWRPTRQACADVFGDQARVEVYGQGNRLHVISDLLTTAGGRWPPLFPLRIVNFLFRLAAAGSTEGGSRSTAPSGFCVIATKNGP